MGGCNSAPVKDAVSAKAKNMVKNGGTAKLKKTMDNTIKDASKLDIKKVQEDVEQIGQELKEVVQGGIDELAGKESPGETGNEASLSPQPDGENAENSDTFKAVEVDPQSSPSSPTPNESTDPPETEEGDADGMKSPAPVKEADSRTKSATSVRESDSGTKSAMSVREADSGTKSPISVKEADAGTRSAMSMRESESGKKSAMSVTEVDSGTKLAMSVREVDSGTKSAMSAKESDSGTKSAMSVREANSGTKSAMSVKETDLEDAKSEPGSASVTPIPAEETASDV